MNNRDKILNLLGLATRARQITLGAEFVIKSITTSPTALVFLATDAGENLTKKINDKAKTYNVEVINTYTSSELSKAMGKENRKVVLVTDKGFIKKFLEYINS